MANLTQPPNYTISNVFNYLSELAPVNIKMKRDNVGLLVGHVNNVVSKVIVSLDITLDVISEAIDEGANLIVSHHPVLYPLSSITDSDVTGSRVLKLIENNIAAICMHTNLDATKEGVNYELARIIGIDDPKPLREPPFSSDEEFSAGRFGIIKNETAMCDFLVTVKNALSANGLRYYDTGRLVSKVAVVGGTGDVEFDHVLKNNCDTFLTADIKYHSFLRAKELGINLIDGGHFCTENVIIQPLADKLNTRFPEIDISVSKIHKQIIKFL